MNTAFAITIRKDQISANFHVFKAWSVLPLYLQTTLVSETCSLHQQRSFSLRALLLLTLLPFHATSGLRAPHPSERTLPVSVSDHSHFSPLSPGFCPLHALPRPPGTSRMPGPWASTGHRCPLPSCAPDLPRPWGRLFLLGPLFSPALLFPVSPSPSAPSASSPLAPLVGSPHQAHPLSSFTYELLPSICT